MLKLVTLIVSFSFFSKSHAAVINSTAGDFFQGREYVNEQPTGKLCYLYVDQVASSNKGQHCQTMAVRAVFATDRSEQPQDQIIVESPVTNYHRAEYPAIKTCAMNLQGKTSENDIYQHEDTNLYIQFLSWNGKVNGNSFDLFVTNSAVTKSPVRVRLHKLNWHTETNFDCLF